MKTIKPSRIQKGDVIGIISPASSPEDLTRIDSGVRYLESLGYRVELGRHVGKIHGYLAGSDEERAEDIHSMFRNKNVKAIICVRGGYGSPRLLDKIDYRLIRNHPKILVGYSDITALLLAIFQKTGLITFAGPMLAVDFYNEVNPYTEDIFWTLLTSKKKIGRISFPEDEKLYDLVKGMAAGSIVGGNLALICSMMGTAFFPSFRNRILLLEDTSEAPYRIDRMLNQLKLAKIFEQVKGIILGAFVDCNEADPSKRTLTLGEVVDDYFGNLNIPVVYNFQHGHIRNNITVPIGLKIKLNASRGIVEYLEPACR
ncbi:MAG: S66 peptidase family protein [Ignavibacteria bacterium]